MVDLKQKKDENDRINALLMEEPEYELVKAKVAVIKALQAAALDRKTAIEEATAEMKKYNAEVEEKKLEILALLQVIEEKTGYARAPKYAHVTTAVETYDVADEDACPIEYFDVVEYKKLVKKRLIDDVKTGKIGESTNWLKINKGQRVVVIDA